MLLDAGADKTQKDLVRTGAPQWLRIVQYGATPAGVAGRRGNSEVATLIQEYEGDLQLECVC